MTASRSAVSAESRRQSYYHLAGVEVQEQSCQGLACFVASSCPPCAATSASRDAPRVYCLGQCYAAPAHGIQVGRPRVSVASPTGIILPRIADGGARTIQEYQSATGYEALINALTAPPERILQAVEQSGLRGRGGAGFPTGVKWRAVAGQSSTPKHVVVNADEGDPGAYIDRFILEDNPHAVIEATLLAGYAVGASCGTIYLRKEYPDAFRILNAALEEARGAGWIGPAVGGTGFAFELDVFRGEGSYVCGEETALLNSLEGQPPVARARPPYPTSQGLYGQPTLVNNVETLANIPWIVTHGAEAYRAVGRGNSRGTKVVSLNSLFRRPGLYEVEFGVPVRHILEDLGGGLRTGEIRGVIIGGPLAGILPPQLFDTPFDFEALSAVGASVGHGGIVAFDDHTSLRDLTRHVFEFAAYESCGKCTPCRVGSRVVAETLGRAARSDGGSAVGSFTRDIVSALHSTSLCGLGTGLADFAASVLRHYPAEVADAFG